MSLPLDKAVDECKALTARLKKSQDNQIRNAEGLAFLKATAFAWLNVHRKEALTKLNETDLRVTDQKYRLLLELAEKKPSKSKVLKILKELQTEVVKIRGDFLIVSTEQSKPPDFAKIIPDATMCRILVNRWQECERCVAAKASLAAIVMMGGLLEAILLSNVNRYEPKADLFKLKSIPVDKATTKKLELKKWTLQIFIDVAHELGWLSQSAKDVSKILQDYRNFVHPQKELTYNVELRENDTNLLWEVAKSIIKQLIPN